MFQCGLSTRYTVIHFLSKVTFFENSFLNEFLMFPHKGKIFLNLRTTSKIGFQKVDFYRLFNVKAVCCSSWSYTLKWLYYTFSNDNKMSSYFPIHWTGDHFEILKNFFRKSRFFRNRLCTSITFYFLLDWMSTFTQSCHWLYTRITMF